MMHYPDHFDFYKTVLQVQQSIASVTYLKNDGIIHFIKHKKISFQIKVFLSGICSQTDINSIEILERMENDKISRW